VAGTTSRKNAALRSGVWSFSLIVAPLARWCVSYDYAAPRPPVRCFPRSPAGRPCCVSLHLAARLRGLTRLRVPFACPQRLAVVRFAGGGALPASSLGP